MGQTAGELALIAREIIRAPLLHLYTLSTLLTCRIGHEVGSTPSSHRQRLNGEASASMNASDIQNNYGGFSTPIQSRNSPAQVVLGGIRARGSSGNGFAGYGMSAGLKVSHTPVGGDGLRNMGRAGTMPRGITPRILLPPI